MLSFSIYCELFSKVLFSRSDILLRDFSWLFLIVIIESFKSRISLRKLFIWSSLNFNLWSFWNTSSLSSSISDLKLDSSIIIFGIFFYLPSIDFSTDDIKPPIEIIPSTIIDESSLRSEIEELKLEVFQKDQRLKFRDDQINNLRNEIRDLNDSIITIKNNHEKSLNNISDLENNTLENNSQYIEKLSILENQIAELKKQLLKITLKSYLSKETFDFLNFLIDHNRINLIFEIIKEYLNLIYKLLKLKKVEIYTTSNFTTKQKEKIIRFLKKITKVYKIIVFIIIDHNLISGLILKIDSKIYDYTIRTQLNLLTTYLNS
jgi:ATP synthase F1 delta subunit